MEHLFVVDGSTATPAVDTDLPAENLHERRHLQEWVINHPRVLGDDVLVVTAEYDRWTSDSDGTSARDRLDVLGIDASGRLVVAELKRGSAERDIHLQAITYAALVSRFTLDTLAAAHSDFLTRRGSPVDLDGARQRLLDHVDGDLDPDVLRRPRLVLLASSFPKQVTHSVVWLSEMNLDIDLVQVRLWRVGNHLTAGFTKLYPTPEVEEFTLAPAREGGPTVIQKAQQRSRAKNAVQAIAEAGVLPEGTLLVLKPGHGVTDEHRSAIDTWAAVEPARKQVRWHNSTSKPLTWMKDSVGYSATGLAEEVCRQALDRDLGGIQGTTWWIVADEQDVPAPNGQDWSVLAGRSLVDLADEVRDVRRDWSDLHAVLKAMPGDRWTTYGDLATVIESGPMAVGAHVSSCTHCTDAWRVLQAKGTVSPGFTWSDPSRQGSATEALEAVGISFAGGKADPARRMKIEDLRSLVDAEQA